MLDRELLAILSRLVGIESVAYTECIQSLWSGYGQLLRVVPDKPQANPVIVKYVSLPENKRHPRGWNSDISHQRKLRSYDVEIHWYQQWSRQCDDACRVAACYGARQWGDKYIIVLEDLDDVGYAGRFNSLDKAGAKLCLRWLAYFHARFMGAVPKGLWPVGSYWHLQTRSEELALMAQGDMKQYAAEIDRLLNSCKYQTLVHGDAKVANFCFSSSDRVAAVDFQYVGGGCGIKDVAYFIGSCLDESQCALWQDELLDEYFSTLKLALNHYGKPVQWLLLEQEWRNMYAVAWTDFYRFLLGWMPGHRKIHQYTLHQAAAALEFVGKL